MNENAKGNGAKSILGTLTKVSGPDLRTQTQKRYGKALFTYKNGRGETKTLTMLAFGKGYESVENVWQEGWTGYLYCRYEVTDKGTTLRAIAMGRAPAAPEAIAA